MLRSLRVRALLTAFVVAAAASAVQVTGIASSPLTALDDAAHDLLLRSQPADTLLGSLGINQAADPRSFITIVAIDERTISELGAYTGGYPRSYHAQVVENLLAAPPRVIAFDFGFFEPTADDNVLATAFAHARSLPVPTSIILGTVGLSSRAQPTVRTPSGELAFDAGLAPVPVLAENASLALANIVADERGTIRSMPLVAYVQGQEQSTLGLAAAASYLRRPASFDAHSATSLEFAGRSIPLDGDAAVRINYFGPPSQPYAPDATFRVISFVDVLRGRVDPSAWRGGLVFVGALGAVGLADDYWTPISDQGRKMAGVEIHANVAATLFSTRFLTDASVPLELLLILAMAVLMALCGATLGAPAAWITPCLLVCAYVAGDAWALYARGLLLPLSTPILAGLVSLSGAAAQRVASEQRYARTLMELLNATVLDNERAIEMGASIGVVVYTDQDRQSAERFALVGALRQAIEGDELELYYQPKIECGSRRLVGVEALARWRHPELGLVGPECFIGLAEETGLIAPLTRWVLSAALHQTRSWLDSGLEVPIAVNLSAFDVQEASMPSVIAGLLARSNVPLGLLSIEITEGALLADPALALDVLQQLQQLGVLASLDDFGSGYSSLGYLKQFPVHELKIDRSLVSDIVREQRDQTIVRSTIDLGHSLGLVVVAEGVEDEATLAMLVTLGCDLAQGFLIARPMPAASLVDWIRDWECSQPHRAAA